MIETADSSEEISSDMQHKFPNLVEDVSSIATLEPEEESEMSNIPQTLSQSPKIFTFSPLTYPSFSIAAVSPDHTSRFEDELNIKAFTSNMNFQYEILRPGDEKAPLSPISQRPRISRSMSLTKFLNPQLIRAADSSTLPWDHSYPDSTSEGCTIKFPIATKELAQRSFRRSHSVPVFSRDGSVSLNGHLNLIQTSPRGGKEIFPTLCKPPTCDTGKKVDIRGHIKDEEPICRICLIEVTNGAETIKMECKCRGELALAHKECVMKWFNIKGNRICDICKQEVRNLPITLPRLQNTEHYNMQGNNIEPVEDIQYRVWQDVPILIIISMVAYFGVLEQLLAGDMGSGSLAISLPFSCIMGLLASMLASAMVLKQYIWIYAIVQFSLVVAFSRIFYSTLHVQAIVAIPLATFSGFGCALVLSCAVVKIHRRTRRLFDESNNNQTPSGEIRSDESLTTTNHRHLELHQSQINPLNHDVEMGVSQPLHPL